ncbi:MAG: Holliday junction branch migration protein RuvA [Solirubrobacterales bacterium]|nr:Holliday junction branch migration protein RuvA [Solirubrobacterales bacterium]
MIALVQGEVAIRRQDHVIVVCSGVGYRLAVSSQTLLDIPTDGMTVVLHAHLVVRDDALSLYGFSTEEERDLFLKLVEVQGVGPKVALGILSGGSVVELTSALASGDAARFQAVPGIGKRIAERIIVELRDKVGSSQLGQIGDAGQSQEPRILARDGLVGLGYTLPEAESLLQGAPAQITTTEDLIAHALKAARR